MGYTEKEVDISRYPERSEDTTSNTVTIGDLHGNAMLFMFFLIREGVLEISSEDYDKLWEIYITDTSEWTKENKKEQLEAAKQIISNAKIIRNDRTIRLIGDELADRGRSDYLTLKILEKLTQENVPIEINISNHSNAFLYAIEQLISGNGLPRSPKGLSFHQATSYADLVTQIEEGLVDINEVLTIISKCYLKNLKLIAYDVENNTLSLYTHAPVGLEVIRSIAIELGVEYSEATLNDLITTIDNINTAFQEHITNNTASSFLYNEDSSLFTLSWNRVYDNLKRPDKIVSSARTVFFGKPLKEKEFHINYIHGHDTPPPDSDEEDIEDEGHILNLDGALGKRADPKTEPTEGLYKTYSANNTHSPRATPIDKKVATKRSLLAILERKQKEERYKYPIDDKTRSSMADAIKNGERVSTSDMSELALALFKKNFQTIQTPILPIHRVILVSTATFDMSEFIDAWVNYTEAHGHAIEAFLEVEQDSLNELMEEAEDIMSIVARADLMKIPLQEEPSPLNDAKYTLIDTLLTYHDSGNFDLASRKGLLELIISDEMLNVEYLSQFTRDVLAKALGSQQNADPDERLRLLNEAKTTLTEFTHACETYTKEIFTPQIQTLAPRA